MRTTTSWQSRFLLTLCSFLISLSAGAATPPALSNPNATLETHLGPAYFGSLMGKASVGAAGNASYIIPIEVPPGTRGMAPSLSINYHSGVQNGLLGLGWFLQGTTSKITRCPQNMAQDGQIRAVDYSANDRFCLDGHRLLATSGTYGAAGTEYRTESDQFSRIKSHGSAGSGPAYFRIERKDGTIAWYGNTGDSRIEAEGRSDVRLWALRRVEDQLGNYYLISYYENNSEGEYYPTRIDYTGNSNVSPALSTYAKVEFSYESRTDNPIKYEAGSAYHPHPKRLKTIKTYVDNSLVRKYTLNYQEVGKADQSRLTQIDSCDALNNCQTPVTLDWEDDGNLTFSESNFTVPYDAGAWAACGDPSQEVYGAPRWHDFNGDGKKDYVHIVPPSNATAPFYHEYMYAADLDFEIKLSTPTGYQTQTWTSGAATMPIHLEWLDMNGDGKTDVVARKPVPSSHKYKPIEVALSTGSSFNNQTWTGHTENNYSIPFNGTSYRIKSVEYEFADVNGDRLPDMVVFEKFKYYSTYYYDVYVHLNTGSDFGSEQTWAAGIQENDDVIDMNGDGMADLVEDGAYIRLSNGSSFGARENWGGAATETLADYNGDGLPDKNGWSGSAYWVYLNSGNGFVQTVSTGMVPFMDMDGNGFNDTYTHSYDSYNGVSTAKLWLSNGNDQSYQFLQVPLYSGVQGRNMFKQLTDFNGDGMADFTVAETHHCYNSYPGYYNAIWVEKNYLRIFENQSQPLNQLKKINHGLGAEVAFTFKSISDADVYTKGTGATYPVQDVQDSRHVVSHISQSDGIGGTFDTEYQYEGLKRHLQGRGDLGFAKITIKNLDQNSTTITEYAQSFPYTHQATKVEVRRTSDNRLLSSTVTTYGTHGTIGSGPVFPYVDNRISKAYNLSDGRLLTTTTTTNNSMDAYGNITDTTVLINDHENSQTFQTQTLSVYTIDTTNWRVGQLTSRTVKNSVGGVNDTSLNRTSSFTYHSSNGLLASKTREPGAGAPLQLTTSYGYDDFGNLDSETISGPGITSRTSSLSYDSRGQFPVTVTNALNHQETSTWDKRFGKPLSKTGPNGFTTSWQYNGFGRKTLETRADGTTTEIAVHEDNSGNNPNAEYYIEVVSTDTAAVRTFYDQLGREVRKRSQGFDGSYTHLDTEYDSQGRSKRASQPYFVGDTRYWNTPSYDHLGRVTAMDAADNTQDTSSSYDGFSVTVTDAGNRTQTKTQNAIGQVIEVEDDAGTLTQFEYNQNGDRITVINAVGTALENEVTYTHDKLGRQLSMTDPDHGTYTYSYNALGEKIEEISPKMAAASQSVTFQYDKLGRITSRTEPEGTSTWTYDNTTGGNKGIGKLHSESQSGYSRSYAYGSGNYGRLTSATTSIDTSSYTSSLTYDSSGRIDTITYPASASSPSGFQVQHTYNALGYLERVQNPNNGDVYYQFLESDAMGKMTEQWLGDGSTLAQSYAAHSSRIIEQHTTTKTSSDLQRFTYAYDSLGNMSSRSDLVQGLSETFGYDNLDRLTEAQVGVATPVDYGYNIIGNITEKSDAGNYSYNLLQTHAVSQVTQGATTNNYSYDDNGNLANGDDLPTITWSSYNKPTQVTQGSVSYQFSYGADRKRYKKVHTSGSTVTTTHYVGDNFEKITDGTTTEYRHIIRANGQAILIRKDFGTIANHLHVHRDHLGSVTALTWASSGDVASQASYDPWGKRRSATDWQSAWSNPGGTPYMNRGFTGHEHLDDIDIIHMNGRIYSPKLGRMLSPDPMVKSAENGQDYNRFSYARNNPLRYTDPNGYIAIEENDIRFCVFCQYLPTYSSPDGRVVLENSCTASGACDLVFNRETGLWEGPLSWHANKAVHGCRIISGGCGENAIWRQLGFNADKTADDTGTPAVVDNKIAPSTAVSRQENARLAVEEILRQYNENPDYFPGLEPGYSVVYSTAEVELPDGHPHKELGFMYEQAKIDHANKVITLYGHDESPQTVGGYVFHLGHEIGHLSPSAVLAQEEGDYRDVERIADNAGHIARNRYNRSIGNPPVL